MSNLVLDINTDKLAFEPRSADRTRTSAEVAADFANKFLMHRHRGVINCDSYFVIFGNDGYATDQRSRIESAEVWGKLRDYSPESGLSSDGCSWAIVLTDHTRLKFNEEVLNRLVWDTWMDVCDRCGHTPMNAGTVELDNPEGVILEDSNWERP